MSGARKLIDLSHVIEDGMITYKGLPAPIVCDWLSFDDSHSHYDPGTEFSMQTATLHSNTGTYMDTPRHRYRDGHDLCGLPLERVCDVDGICVDATREDRRIGAKVFAGLYLAGKAVLVRTGWDRHWRTDQYFEDHPFLSEEAAIYLRAQNISVVGIDSYNIDDTSGGTRPVHSVLLGAGIPIVEHMTNLGELPQQGFRFTAVPPKIKDMGTFPVRAHAIID